ncbi:hypothetical protein GCM10027278_17170 [Paralcaligenes ginsengisoli]
MSELESAAAAAWIGMQGSGCLSVKGVHSPGGCGRREFRDRPIQAAAAGSPGKARTGRGELHPAWAATPAS